MSQPELMKVRVELGDRVFDLHLATAPSFWRSLVILLHNITFTNLNKEVRSDEKHIPQ